MNDIRKGDGVVLWDGSRGIALTKPFKPQSMGVDGLVIAVEFEHEWGKLQMPIELRSIVEVWRNQVRIDDQPVIEQMELF